MTYLCLFAWGILAALAADPANPQLLPAVPEGYYLHAYDDCGIEARQPHVLMTNSYLWTFQTSDTDAGLKERSAVFSYKGIQAVYSDLPPQLTYVLALTYASDHVYNRVQSLEADGLVLHGPLALSKAKATRVIVKVPPEATRDGHLTLSWKIHGEVNATVSIIELWANAPATNGLTITSLVGLSSSLQGQVFDLAFDGVARAKVSLSVSGQKDRLTAATDANGLFSFNRTEIESLAAGDELILIAQAGQQEGRGTLSRKDLFFTPIHYRPLPAFTAGLDTNCLLLDGEWRMNPAPNIEARTRPLNGSGWASFNVPGQWLQQGFDVPKERAVAVAREFTLPQAWSGNRIILRFDAIHAGTTYWLNGHKLGYSENLFTPVEWDITETAQPGRTNRLDLEMVVATVSEALSISSGYAFHNLGGIDRSVRVFALPPIHLQQLHLKAGLDRDYRDGELRLNLVLCGGERPIQDLSLAIRLQDSTGKTVQHSLATVAIEPFTGTKTLDLVTQVDRPWPWSAEKPNLYRLVLELRQAGATVERVERNLGFRNIEIRGRQLFVNGRRLKIAGVCRHETDPLTGRANTVRHAETDVRLLKEANLNYIRTSHYPPTAELLEAADRLGMYVEVEAPFCWVGDLPNNSTNLSAVLTPTTAMVDYHHTHPSVIVWSIANESEFNLQFYCATKVCKELDPTRPTTFNNPDLEGSFAGRVTDIANWHYPPWPYDSLFAEDSRPIFLGEYFFEITHEQTDVRINPGLRELWGHGHAEPASAFGRACAQAFDLPPLKPGLKPGGWSDIYHSDRVIGGAIWAAFDDAFYFSETQHAGYAWHHGFWGLIDSWRRPKPEWWLARHIFSPVWLETRQAAFVAGQETIRLPVENRFVFTDFSELQVEWEINRNRGQIHPQLAPGTRGELRLPVPPGTAEGDSVYLRVTSPAGVLLDESVICLGQEKPAALPKPSSGPPRWREEGEKLVFQGTAWSAVFDRVKGDFDAADPRHTCAVSSFPTAHVTRYDFGDLNGPNSPPYAVFPDARTRRFDRFQLQEEPTGLRLTVHDHYENFAGSISWIIDRDGRGIVSCDYLYSGPTMDTREAGIRFVVKPVCDHVTWRRWSEWGSFPENCISRAAGSAPARREARWGVARWNVRPAWPWSQDETELGTADFRAVKFHVYEAALVSPDGAGLSLHANADAHFRAALTPGGVTAHLLWRCPLGQVPLKSGDRIQGQFVVQLRAPR